MKDEKRASCSDRLALALSLRGMKQSELCAKTGIPKSAISQYISGEFKPKQNRVFLIAQALNVDEAWLMGYDVPMEPVKKEESSSADQELSEMLETLRTREDMRMLFKLSKEATPEDVRQAVKIIEALRKND